VCEAPPSVFLALVEFFSPSVFFRLPTLCIDTAQVHIPPLPPLSESEASGKWKLSLLSLFASFIFPPLIGCPPFRLDFFDSAIVSPLLQGVFFFGGVILSLDLDYLLLFFRSKVFSFLLPCSSPPGPYPRQLIWWDPCRSLQVFFKAILSFPFFSPIPSLSLRFFLFFFPSFFPPIELCYLSLSLLPVFCILFSLGPLSSLISFPFTGAFPLYLLRRSPFLSIYGFCFPY